MSKSNLATPLLTQADALRRFKADIFSVLAHPTRIHIVECLSEGEQAVSTLLASTGVEPANLSQHLAILRAKHLVVCRKDGNQAFYRLKDSTLAEVLASMKRYFLAHLEESLAILRELEAGE
jgi:DNA-binding transcriptional ArsR family regulator